MSNVTYLEARSASEREEARLRWSYGWSPVAKKAFIVTGQGFTVIGPVLSAQAAGELCRQHNNAIKGQGK